MVIYLLLLVFPAAMILAAVFDLFTMTIPNWLTAGLAAVFPLAAFAAGMGTADFAMHVLAGLAVLLIGFAMFSFGWIGGGDAKLVAAAALWFGWEPLLAYSLLFSVFGGALTIGLLMARRLPLPAPLWRQEWLLRLHDRQTGVPYGLALSFAAIVMYPHTPWMVAAMA